MTTMQDFSSETILQDEYAAVNTLLLEVRMSTQFERLVESWVNLSFSIRNAVAAHGEPDGIQRAMYVYSLYTMVDVGNSIVKRWCEHGMLRDSLPFGMTIADVHAYLKQAAAELHSAVNPPSPEQIQSFCQLFGCEQ
jgi:hypothetical protein